MLWAKERKEKHSLDFIISRISAWKEAKDGHLLGGSRIEGWIRGIKGGILLPPPPSLLGRGSVKNHLGRESALSPSCRFECGWVEDGDGDSLDSELGGHGDDENMLSGTRLNFGSPPGDAAERGTRATLGEGAIAGARRRESLDSTLHTARGAADVSGDLQRVRVVGLIGEHQREDTDVSNVPSHVTSHARPQRSRSRSSCWRLVT